MKFSHSLLLLSLSTFAAASLKAGQPATLADVPDPNADAEKAGFKAYMAAGCQACHSGVLLGGNIYQKLGAAEQSMLVSAGIAELGTKLR